MILHQFYLNCLAHASYLIGDELTRTAAVVDPQRDVDQYLTFADSHGLQVKHVFLTHFHADFVAGHLELRDRVGATIYLGRAAKAEFAFTPLADGDRVELGRVRLQALETPGHTAESISILVFELERCAVPPHVTRLRPSARAARLYAVVCRPRPPGPSFRTRVVGCRPWRATLRLAVEEAAAAARRKPRLSGPRRGIAVRQGNRQGNRVDHR